ncbi:MAG: prolipoprotein diacylglyceryl transferase [Acidimicrobiia bacterium]|nr:prolipoprotein diacylglyceryl transferase [Acidimicrobiia bacterium]
MGARVYHVITDYQLYTDDWLGVFRIWSGGLSIWGAVAGGAIAVVVLARVRRLDTLALMDAMAPGIALAQAIGRWGNWFNQELFGRPTDLPWGLEIDPARRPAGYEQTETFHPTFLYESLWCLAIAGTLIWAEKRFRFARGQTFALYVALYTFGRFWFENLRIDTAHEVLGLRVNAWVSIGLFVASLAWFAWLGRRRRDLATEPGQPGPSGEAEEVGAGASPAGPADSAESEAIRPGSDGVAD